MDPNNQPQPSPTTEQSHGETSSAQPTRGNFIDNVKSPSSGGHVASPQSDRTTLPATETEPTTAPDDGQTLKQPESTKRPVSLPDKTPSHNSPAVVVILAIIVIILLLAVTVFAYIHSQSATTTAG